MRRQPSPADGASEAKLIELCRIVLVHPRRENLLLPCVRRNFKTLQLSHGFQQSSLAAQLRLRSHVLPAQQPAHELCSRNRLNLLAERGYGEVVNARQQTPIAPLGGMRLVALRRSGEVAPQN